MGQLTTHVLDTSLGKPASAVRWTLCRIEETPIAVSSGQTNDDGRNDGPLLCGADLVEGTYELEFQVAEYFRNQGIELPEPAFLDRVVIRFGIADPSVTYHVPLLVSPYGYSTYRGS
ncbi:MAG: hydroxyisourate hydrolase [Pseudomonadota bacterium]|jgi:5-hydroxyisourate hydrolase|nr:hydroxyisourate hydrolase [Pseudomonadota bacterium]